MEQNRCIFCMHVIDESKQLCPDCHRGVWEYNWKELWLEPGTMRKEKYYIGAVLGEGPESITYLGYDTVLEQKVVVKEYRHDIWEQQKRKEAQLLFGRFDVKGMVVEKDYFTEDQKGYIIMEYLPGGTLLDYLKQHGSMGAEEAVKMLGPVMEAADYLHSFGVVHGAIVPEHLIFDGEGELRLIGKSWSRRGDEEGTSPYMAPEQMEGLTGPWTDVYALCAVLYEMITGRKVPPVRERIKRDKLKKPSAYAQISTGEEQSLLEGLALDVQMRYFSIGTLAEQLEIKSDGIRKTEGVIRHEWGEKWLKITTQTEGRNYREHQRKRIIRWERTAVLVGIMFCITGGVGAFLKTHQNVIYQYKLNQAQKYDATHKRVRYLVRGDEGYKEIRKFAEKYGKTDEKSNEEIRKCYTVQEETLKKCSKLRGTYGTFYLDKDTMLDAILYNMKIKKEDLNAKAEIYTGTVLVYADEIESLKVWIAKTAEYKSSYKNVEEELELRYDPTDRQVIEVRFQGEGERCSEFLAKMLPLISPETYLTGEEAKELVGLASGSDGGKNVDLTAKCRVYVSTMWNDASIYSVTVSVPGE